MPRPRAPLPAALVVALVGVIGLWVADAFVPPQLQPSTPPLRLTTRRSSSSSAMAGARRASGRTSLWASTMEPEVPVAAPKVPAEGEPSGPGCLPSHYWIWNRGPAEAYRIRYTTLGMTGPHLILLHGFGANSDHWRKNMPVLAEKYRVHAIDLLGYGYSDKPSPKRLPPTELYNFETWARQLEAFVQEVVKPDEGEGIYIACNSVGGLAGLQFCVDRPDLVDGILLLNISLRMLHIKKQPFFLKPFVKALQTVLRETELGRIFFAQVATPKGVKNALSQAYHNKEQVTDELVDIILKPGLQPGAVDVFLDFTSYSGGPLPEELLPQIDPKIPVYIGWGEADPWEPIELGKAYGEFPCVREFVRLPNVGHCPQDEAPELVNPLIMRMVDTIEAERKGQQAGAAAGPTPATA